MKAEEQLVMEFHARSGDLAKVKTGAAVIWLFEGEKLEGKAKGSLDNALAGALTRLVRCGEVRGKREEVTVVHTFDSIAPDRVAVVGLGKRRSFDLDEVRKAAAAAARVLDGKQVESMALSYPEWLVDLTSPAAWAGAVAEGVAMGLYRFEVHKTKKNRSDKGLRRVEVVSAQRGVLPQLRRGLEKGEIIASAVNSARDLVNEGPNIKTPTFLARAAQRMARRSGLRFASFGPDRMRTLGMGGLLGVSQGTQQSPRLIELHYDPEAPRRRSRKPAVGLVGKGLTFDSGGISLKPAANMDEMKGDMSGAAAVIAAMEAIGRLKPPIAVSGIVAATENMPGPAAYRPGDVVTFMNGKTAEIINTDAEGRLVLADALCYARRLKLNPIVDVATLTGACAIAVGPICSGLFGTDRELVDLIQEAGLEMGEKNWPMPLYDEYAELIKGTTGDIKNTGGREGGAITAAMFLKEFVEDSAWAHLDIAGTFYKRSAKGYNPKGATGVAVRTLISTVLRLADARA